MQLARLDRPPDAPSVPGVDFVTPSPVDFADAVGQLQQSSAEQRAALLERVAHTPVATRAMIATADRQPVGTGTVMLEDGFAGIYSMVTAPAMRIILKCWRDSCGRESLPEGFGKSIPCWPRAGFSAW